MHDEASRRTTLAVVLASAGRPALLADALRCYEQQEEVDFRGIISVPDEASLPDEPSLLYGWEIVSGTRGLAAQRNAGLDLLDDVEIVAFFDDDAVARSDYLARAVRFLAAHPEVVGLTGRVLLDGKITGEIDRTTTDAVLERSASEARSDAWRPTRELYGANFVVRRSAAPSLRFDERLPLYSWLEDHDFARRLMPFGLLAHVDDCVIVHRAAASGGRQNHRRLGYSQVMNAIHLVRKGSFPAWLAAQQIFRPVAKNVALSVAGPNASWRRQRLRGNLMAVTDVARGRITPERITEL
ncbi:glycosyltransferase family 2 protein [Actinomycetospora rhizophila]|uniref:Glycosyltransferase family 2 protein n=1 Tax=Actinomycetospora rhizophila TaxID=1416876 RepID=A0ABV9ZP12_9PSEU